MTGVQTCALPIYVLKLDAQYLIDKYGQPDFIWASPPCTTFSVASCPIYWHYVNGVLTPKDDRVYHGIAMVKKTISLIEQLKPKLGWLIENPRGMLRKMDFMEHLPRRTITYCQYGDFRMKPTDLWGTVPGWVGKTPCKPGSNCHESSPRGSSTGTQRLSKSQRSMIPYKLGEEICVSLE